MGHSLHPGNHTLLYHENKGARPHTILHFVLRDSSEDLREQTLWDASPNARTNGLLSIKKGF